MRAIIPGFASISQFENGLPTGMCGPIATLGALHNKIDPEGYQMDAAGIQKIFDFERARGLCASNGAQNISHVFEAVRALYPAGAADIELVDYAQFSLSTFHAVLKNLLNPGGLRAIIVEYANGQALVGDQAGLQYHFNSIGGIDTQIADEGLSGGYATCDGDAKTDKPDNEATDPIWHTWPTLVAAQPIAYVLCAR